MINIDYIEFNKENTNISLSRCNDCIFSILTCKANPEEDIEYANGPENKNIIKCKKFILQW